ncbi:MAG TPA: hypothetical protein VGM80_15275 [Gaiellaceae bacterium]
MAAGGRASSRAIVTLAVGGNHASRWHAVCEPEWQLYCDRHGLDLICIEEPLDVSARARGRSPAWQKCLILGHPDVAGYEQVAWVDADILPNPTSPCVFDGVPLHLVGAVDEYATPTHEIHARVLRKLYDRWEADGIIFVSNLAAPDFYRNYGLPDGFESVVQTGVMVLSPAHHRELLERAYAEHEDHGPGWNYEMRPLSYELLKAGVVHWIDHRFNYLWGHYRALHFPFLDAARDHPDGPSYAARALAQTYFLHFTGSVEEMAGALSAEPVPAAPTFNVTAARELAAPVVLLVHARPELTRRLVEVVREARPSRVLVVADGPRADVPGEDGRCAAVREAIASAGFDCEVLTNYATENLGLKRRVETGLDWAFDLVEEAIILEDDCLPDPTFFEFSEELLTRYRDDSRVTTISGNNFGHPGSEAASYVFSRYPLIWGWATWRRAWRLYDPAFSAWAGLRESGWLEGIFDDPQAVQYWTYIFAQRQLLNDTWDGAWMFASWLANGLCAVPGRNLVSNLGFGDGATNTRAEYRGFFSEIPAVPIGSPLRHPSQVERDVEVDAYLEQILFSGNLGRLFRRIRTLRPVTPASPR